MNFLLQIIWNSKSEKYQKNLIWKENRSLSITYQTCDSFPTRRKFQKMLSRNQALWFEIWNPYCESKRANDQMWNFWFQKQREQNMMIRNSDSKPEFNFSDSSRRRIREHINNAVRAQGTKKNVQYFQVHYMTRVKRLRHIPNQTSEIMILESKPLILKSYVLISFVQYVLTSLKTSKLRLVNTSWVKKPRGIRTSDSGIRISDFGFWDFEFWNQNFWFGIRISDFFVQYVFTSLKCGVKNTKIETCEHFLGQKTGGITISDFGFGVWNKESSDFGIIFCFWVLRSEFLISGSEIKISD